MLRGLASKLRMTLGDAGLDPAHALATALGAYQLHLPVDAVVDVEEATANRDAALAAMAAGDAARSVELAGAAVAVASRQFVPGATGPWIERRQAELRELHVSALEIVARAAACLGRDADALTAAEEAIALGPLRESAYLALIGAHATAGNRGEALRAYERCRRVLAEELGVNPSPSTEAAYLALLQDDVSRSDRHAAVLPLPAQLASAAAVRLWGREAELDRLVEAFNRTATEGGRAVLLGGEAGMGKTALVAAGARQAHAAGARILYGRCDEDLELPYQPFAEALSHFVAHAAPSELRDHVDAHGGDLARLAPDLSRRLPNVPPPPSTDPEADRYRLFEIVAALLAGAGKLTPLVLVLDDLHWATSGTLQLLRHVLRSTSSACLLVLGTYRHTEISDSLANTLADLRREAQGVDRLQLEGLDTDAVAGFIESMHGLADDDEGLAQAEAVRVHTGGNPFFVGELLRHLAETGATYRRRGPWSYYAGADDVGVPQGVQEVVARRLRRLSEAANELVVWASVIGAEFDLGLLEQLGDGRDPFDAVEEAVRGHVVVEVSPSNYRFSHALVRDTVYSGLTATRRARLHRRVGEVLEASPGGRERVDALAHHFAAAATAGCAAKAADYALAAARQSIDHAAWEEAIAVLERVLAVQEGGGHADPERRCDLLLLLAETWTRHYNPAMSVEAAQQALALARGLDCPERLGAAAYWYVRGLLGARARDSEDATQTAVKVAREVSVTLGDDAPSWRARLLAICPELRENQDRLATRREALALARETGDANAIGVALSFVGGALGPLRVREVLDVAEEMVSAVPPNGWDGWRNGIVMRCKARLSLGDRDGFQADVDACDRFGRERRFWFFRWTAKYYEATLALLDGRFGEVDAIVADAARIAPEGFGMAQEVGRRQRFRARYEEGDDEQTLCEARALVERFAENPIHLSMLAFAKARLNADGAGDDLERFVKQGPSGPMPPERVPVSLAYRAEVAMALPRGCTAENVYAELLAYRGQVVIGGMAEACQGAVDRFLGMLSGKAGRWDDAREHFESALAIEAGLRSPPLMAWTRYWCGRFDMERGDTDDARTSLSAPTGSSPVR